jgi:hypothetical protein
MNLLIDAALDIEFSWQGRLGMARNLVTCQSLECGLCSAWPNPT